MRKHGWFRPHVRGLTAISSTTLREGGGDIITSIFADGTDGFCFDFSKTDRLFQGSTGGSAADDAGENIGLGLEGSKWAGKTFAELVASQPELVTNGDFSNGMTGWSGAWSIVGGEAVGGPGGAALMPSGAFPVTVGKLYRVSFRVISTPYLDVRIGGVSAGIGWSAGTHVRYLRAITTEKPLFAAGGGSDSTIDDISIKEIPGNHGLQATTSAQPKWQTGGLARFDGTDDYHATTLVPATAFTFMFKLKMPAKGLSTKIISGCRGSTDTRSYIGMNNDGTLAGGLGSQPSTTIKGSVDRGGSTGVATMAWDGSRVELLWNAASEYEAAQAGSIQTTQPIYLGGWNDNGTAGSFSDTDIYYALGIKKRLTQAQIAAITNKWGTS